MFTNRWDEKETVDFSAIFVSSVFDVKLCENHTFERVLFEPRCSFVRSFVAWFRTFCVRAQHWLSEMWLMWRRNFPRNSFALLRLTDIVCYIYNIYTIFFHIDWTQNKTRSEMKNAKKYSMYNIHGIEWTTMSLCVKFIHCDEIVMKVFFMTHTSHNNTFHAIW